MLNPTAAVSVMAARASHIFSLPLPCRLPNAQTSVGFQTYVLLREGLVDWQRSIRLRYLVTSGLG